MAAAAQAELATPPLRARVTDQAGLLPAEIRERLETQLAAFERETTHQIAVLSVTSLEGEPIEAFSLRVAEAWQLGQRGLDNGILLLVAAQDRQARIEVGYGLEGVVPDAIAKRVLEDVVIPRFRAGDPAAGIEAGVAALMQAARGEEIPAERRPARPGAPHADPLSVLGFAAMLAAVFGAPFRRARLVGALLGGAVASGVTWLILARVGWAAAAFAIGALLGALGASGAGSRRRGGPGGILVPGGFGGRGGGFGGGFGGRGGGFGGGGASGRW